MKAPSLKSKLVQDFRKYVLSFYGRGQIYGDFFDHTLKVAEVDAAIKIRLSNLKVPFEGDTVDRELVRDIMLVNRGEKKTEFPVRKLFMKNLKETP